MRQMAYDSRASASNKLQTPEEVAANFRAALNSLDAERVARMNAAPARDADIDESDSEMV